MWHIVLSASRETLEPDKERAIPIPSQATFYLHVGTHKTGTTFMQNNVFPKFRGIDYIHPWSQIDALLRLDADRRYLLSNERFAGRRGASRSEIDHSLAALSGLFPGAKILISFRPHDSFITSSYKQYLHKGGTLPMEEYFDIERDSGVTTREQFLYRPRIESIVQHFGESPFVFLLDEIKNGLPELLQDLGAFLSATAPAPEDVVTTARNAGVNYYQAKILRRLNRFHRSELNPAGRFNLNNRIARALKMDPRRLCQYWLGFLPNRGSLVSEKHRQMMLDFYREDWDYVLSCASGRLRGYDVGS